MLTRHLVLAAATVMGAHRAGDGSEHLVAVERTPEGRWRVLDIADGNVVVIDTLTGHDDRLAQAEALARDYAAEQDAYHRGVRAGDPLPRPVRDDTDESPWAA
jgi:hypothetical protein